MTTLDTDKARTDRQDPSPRAVEIANGISSHQQEFITGLEGEARALACIMLDMVATYEALEGDITSAFNKAKRPGEDGADSRLLLDVMGELGYETVTEVFQGLAELLTEATGGIAMNHDDAVARLRRHARDHRVEIGEPALLGVATDRMRILEQENADLRSILRGMTAMGMTILNDKDRQAIHSSTR